MTDNALIVDFEETGSFSAIGKVMGLIGPSGSGKTTLMEQIAGLRECGKGTINLCGETLFNSDTGINVSAAKRAIGFMFQDKLLFPHMTVAQNIHFSEKLRASHFETPPNMIEDLNLAPLMDKYPHQISGGEKQRVCLARAICSQPKLLILDEPTSGLDPNLRDKVITLLRQQMKHIKCPILFVTHYMDDIIELCDTLTVMADGKIVASGPLSDILCKPDIQPFLGYREIITEIEGQTSLANDGILKLQAGPVTIRLENDHQMDSRRRIRIRARDIALALKEPSQTSMQNIIPGIISKIADHGLQEVLVTVALGVDGKGPEIKSLITMRSKKDLQLTAGLAISVMIKAVAVQSPS